MIRPETNSNGQYHRSRNLSRSTISGTRPCIRCKVYEHQRAWNILCGPTSSPADGSARTHRFQPTRWIDRPNCLGGSIRGKQRPDHKRLLHLQGCCGITSQSTRRRTGDERYQSKQHFSRVGVLMQILSF